MYEVICVAAVLSSPGNIQLITLWYSPPITCHVGQLTENFVISSEQLFYSQSNNSL